MKSTSRKPQSKRKYFKSRGFSRLFCFSWEQRKLGEMGQTYTGLSGKTKDDFGHGQARFVTYMNVFSNPISNPEMTEPIEIDPKQNEVEVGDVFFTTSSETPEEVGMSSILLEKRGKTYLNSFCFGFRPSEKIDSYYLAYMLRSESARAKITLLAQGISRYNISKNKVMEIAVSLPSLDEQKMIGQYFSQLDNLITLHQRNSIGYIFKVRAYTNAWEQRKFEDLYDYASEGGTPDTNNPAFYEGGKIPFVKIEDTVEKYIDSPKSYITEEGMNHSSAWLIPKGNVIFTNGATVGNVAINRLPVTTKQGILGIIPSKKVTSEFLFYLLSSTEFQREVRSRMATGTFATIILKSLNEIHVCFPSNTNEQESIITILSRLDNLITLHQRERKNRLFGGKNVKQYNFSRSVLQLLRAMDTRLQRRGCSQGDYG